MPTLKAISQACPVLHDPVLYRSIFLLAFYAFLRLANIAPHSKAAFSPSRHLLHKDIIFAQPGAHILIKWAKNMQKRTEYKFIQIPFMQDIDICPVRALRQLLASRNFEPHQPLFAENVSPCTQVIDTKISDALKKIPSHLNIPIKGHTFHAFRRSGAIVAFGQNVNLEDIKAHGNWHSDAIFDYLRADLSAPPSVPRAFQALC